MIKNTIIGYSVIGTICLICCIILHFVGHEYAGAAGGLIGLAPLAYLIGRRMSDD